MPRRRVVKPLLALSLGVWLGAALVTLPGCGDSGDDCLSWGENCSQSYKQATYGTTSIQCCEGQCRDHGSGIVTCGS